jgi:predicted ATPase
MPGRRLNDNERHLLNFWQNPPQNLQRPFLRSIEIGGGTGLRGINGLVLPFRYPITAICGGNGAGKSTILALAALAFHSPAGWYVHRGNTAGKNVVGDRTYYTFSDFFMTSATEAPPNGVSVTWRYTINRDNDSSTTFTKRRGWGRYASRPTREVDFVPLGRILPAYEMSGVRSTFLNPACRHDTASLNPEFRRLLSYIIGKPYELAEVQQTRRYSIQRCEAGAVYTGFNMGGGEACIIGLLHLIQRMPRGGLLVIEEIEAGLHPEAQAKLAEVLITLCLQKQLQIICSTHSHSFIDSLPRQARLLLKKTGDDHFLFENPSTRFAMHEMTGHVQPELTIYCEDNVAAMLISEALPMNNRARVKVQDIGSGATVIRQGVSHLRSGFPMRAFCVLDGDCAEANVRQWINSEAGNRAEITPEVMTLPGGGLPPERWLVQQLLHPAYRASFAQCFGCTEPEAHAHIEALQVEIEHHDIGYVLHRRTNIGSIDCIQRTVKAIAPRHPQLDALREKVQQLLT